MGIMIMSVLATQQGQRRSGGCGGHDASQSSACLDVGDWQEHCGSCRFSLLSVIRLTGVDRDATMLLMAAWMP